MKPRDEFIEPFLQRHLRFVTQHAAREAYVGEAMPHVADPMLFFNAGGDPEVMNQHLEAMMGNVIACLDLDRLRSTTMSEYLLKTLGGWTG